MAAMLQHLHRHIRNAQAEVESYCCLDSPEVFGLREARSRLRLASVTRAEYVKKLLETVDDKSLTENQKFDLQDMNATYSNLKFLASLYVATWTEKKVAADWRGFCLAARNMRALMEEHMLKEEKFIHGYFRAEK